MCYKVITFALCDNVWLRVSPLILDNWFACLFVFSSRKQKNSTKYGNFKGYVCSIFASKS